MDEKEVVNKENDNVYVELLYSAFDYLQEHPIMLAGVGLSVCSTCFILSSCFVIEKKLKGGN